MPAIQAVIASARTLQDINEDRVVPGDFLGVLLLLFFFMVLDRLFYTLGLHFGKVNWPNLFYCFGLKFIGLLFMSKLYPHVCGTAI